MLIVNFSKKICISDLQARKVIFVKFPKESAEYELRLSAGRYLMDIRTGLNKTITSAAKSIGISTAYLSEIEKGLKVPSDILIRAISEFYNIDEDTLFRKFDKIPLFAREEFKKQGNLQSVLSDISRKNIPETHKQRLYDSITKLYREFLEAIEETKIAERGDDNEQ